MALDSPTFSRLVDKFDMGDDCWEWKAGRNRQGYGKFKLNGKTRLAHRVVYEEFVGPIPAGLQLDHRCVNPCCVRPGHLEPVTCQENLLRGNTFQGINARKTHCPKGHEYSRVNSAGSRECGTCRREQSRKYELTRVRRKP